MSATLVRRTTCAGIAVLTVFALTAMAPPVSAVPADGADPLRFEPVKRACPRTPSPNEATCLALVRTDVKARRDVLPLGRPAGLGAIDLQRAYRLPTTAGKGQTIAIIDVGDDPKAEADMAVYRAQFGLPPCTTRNGCFKKVNENGGSELPPPDPGWAEEESLDLDMVSAACPNCHILLVEASKPALATLGMGVNAAVRLGARFVSNSYGGGEDATVPSLDHSYFEHPGVAITAASGDGGYGVLYPATSQYVTAVGGTSLKRAANARGWNETAWSGAGSGCAAIGDKPAWQKDTGCARRTVADVSAVADPRTGVAAYDTYQAGGWLVVGGTSASAPIIAGAYALAGTPPPEARTAEVPYAHASALNDIVSGGNGTCTPAYLCTAGPGYDGPTGLGTPNGVAAFRGATPALAGPEHPREHVRQPGHRARPLTRPVSGTAPVPAAGIAPRPAAGAAPRPASEPAAGIANGGFENGDLSGWTAAGTMTGVTRESPHSGKYTALLGDMDTPRKGDSSLTRRFTAARTHRRLSFWYKVSCPDKVRYDWAFATLRDETAGVDHTVLEKTCAYDDTWRRVESPVTGGHAYTLTLVNHDDGYFGDPTATRYDDVALS